MLRWIQFAIAVICIPAASIMAPAGPGDFGLVSRLNKPKAESHARVQNVTQKTARKRRGRRKVNAPLATRSGATTSASQSKANATSQPPTSIGPLSGITYELPIRKPVIGEEQLKGLLTRVECPSRAVIFNITAGDRTLKLSARSLNSIRFTTFTQDVSGDIACGWRKPPNTVVVTFRPPKVARATYDGELVAVEFVPKAFELKK